MGSFLDKKQMLIRIALDTNIVRELPHHLHAWNLPSVTASGDQLRYSLSATAFAELIEQFQREFGGFNAAQWQVYAATLENILDREWPILPNGRDLSGLTGIVNNIEVDEPFVKSYLQAVWQQMREGVSFNDLSSRRVFRHNNTDYELSPLASQIKVNNQKVREAWNNHINSHRATNETFDDILATIQADRSQIAGDTPRTRDMLDGPDRYLARKLFLTNERTGYEPLSERNRGDAYDLDLLYLLPLPAFVCTTDRRFQNFITQSGALAANQIVHPEEITLLSNTNELTDRISRWRTRLQQHEIWQIKAYLHWCERGCPLWEDNVDWHLSEPIA